MYHYHGYRQRFSLPVKYLIGLLSAWGISVFQPKSAQKLHPHKPTSSGDLSHAQLKLANWTIVVVWSTDNASLPSFSKGPRQLQPALSIGCYKARGSQKSTALGLWVLRYEANG